MKFMKPAICVALLLSAVQAWSYDVDTHFYGTYTMARFAGIKHEVAMKLATGAQWMDESYISDPVSLIILPDVGVKKRRLLHFPGSRIANKLTIDKLPTYLDPTAGVALKQFTETEAEHPFATEMFTEGLMEGNLMKVSAGLHTLEDSFAHAGTIAELGHAHFWHHPDRPFIDEQSVDKYFKMSRSVLKAMVAVRTLLPFGGVDVSYQAPGAVKPNYQLSAEELGELYEQNEDIKATIAHKTLNNPKYVKTALRYVLGKAKTANYITSDAYLPHIETVTNGVDAYQGALEVVPKLLSLNIVNRELIMQDSDLPSVLSSDFIESMGGLRQLVGRFILNFLGDKVPRPLTAYHRFEKEEDGELWKQESEIRELNMRGLIKKLFNKNIYFVENKTKDLAGFRLEFARNAAANVVFPSKEGQPDVEFATYVLAEKVQFNNMIFSFLFPKLSQIAGKDLEKVKGILLASNSSNTGYVAVDKVREFWQLVVARITSEHSLKDLIQAAREDIFDARLKPHEKNKYFTVQALVEKEKQAGTFKSLLTQEELNSLIAK